MYGCSCTGASHSHNFADYIHVAYKNYKPIGVAATGQDYLQKAANMNMAGVVFAKDNPEFENEFVRAIAHMRFWDRK